MSSLSILQLNNRIPWPLNDGGNIATWHVTKFLHDFGHKVTFAALNTNKHHQNPEVLSDIARVHAVEINTDISAIGAFLALFSKLPYNLKRFESAGFRELLVQLLTQEKFDLVLVETAYMGLYLDTIRKHFSGPVLMRSHNVEHQIWERMANGAGNPMKRLYLKNLVRKIRRFEIESADGFDGIIAITEGDRDWYARYCASEKLFAINAGVRLDRFLTDHLSQKSPLPVHRIGFLGSLEWPPNVEALHWFLERVWPQVHAAWPEAEFHVAGKNPPQDLQQLKVPGMIFHGEIERVPDFFAKNPVLVVPLRSGGGMRLKVVEAMGAGVCVVSTGVGAEGVDYTPGKQILEANSPEEFVKTLLSLRENPEKARKVGLAALQKAKEKYDWEAKVREFEGVFDSFLNQD